ncbi:MAG: ATP-binding protein [Methanothrix sp.]|uniref:ATP-binding protein n=1 Tax=Methanothrix sp. TaxID=90426 RepID=UPI0025FC37DE|nr:ATP-binding protein [Methanothrix sp.]MCQ8903009.1 ATP-binding protein [Methanothrix sp.]
MKQIVVISGKGGTGKTSIVASFAACASGRAVIADCDVDAPDLHIILNPVVRERRDFFGIRKASIDKERCTECGACVEHCRFDAIKNFEVDPSACEGCGVCMLVCVSDAVKMVEHLSGHAYISDTRYGPLVHADLFPGEEASGKLVTMVREMARSLAESLKMDMVLIDGSPGTGCPVIASLSGADLALIVTEPTVSGVHDLDRILDVAEHFRIRAMVCINKYDINEETSENIELACNGRGVEMIGRIPFDTNVIDAMVRSVPVVELSTPAACSIKQIWSRLVTSL